MMSNSNKPSAFKAKPTQQQTPAEYQNSERAAARRPVEGTTAQRQAQQQAAAQLQAQQQAAAQRQAQQQAMAQRQAQQRAAAQRQAQQQAAAQRQAQQQAAAQRQAQQRAAAQRQAQQQAAAQRQAQQQAAAQRRPQQQVSAQHQVQQAAAQQRVHQQTTATRATQKPVTQNRTRTQQPNATAQRPLQQQAATQRQVQQQAAATQHRIQPQAAQQAATAPRRTPTQAAAQRPVQQTATAQRRAPAQAAAQRPVQQVATAQRRAPAQAAAQRPAQQAATAPRRDPAQAAAQRPAQQAATAQRRAPAQTAAQRPAQQAATAQRRAPAQAAAQRPAQQAATTQRRAPAQAAAQCPAQQAATAQRRAPAQAAAQRPVQQAATAQTPTARRATKAPGQTSQSGVAAQRAGVTKKRLPQEQKLTRQEKKAAKLTAKGRKQTASATQTQPQRKAQPTAAVQAKPTAAKSPVKKQRGPKQPLPPTLKGKIQYGFQQIGPTVAEIQADPYKKAIATRVIIIVLALLLSIRLTSVINDILGFGRSTDSVTFTISEDDMTTNKIIGQLDRKGFIKHSVECKVFIALTDSMRSEDYTKATYLKGDYVLSKNMGIEKMLLQCMNIQRQETVEVSVPEGYNVVQIGEALEKNKVCSQEDFLKACSKTDYDFDFLQNIDNADSRYAALEGYLYPDTYEFYVGQDAESVVKKMLSNFQSKWTDEYEARAEEINMTMDQVLTMASIVQKEDSKASNMAYISSVFYNRLNSSSFPTLQSDATVNYVKEYIKPQVTESEYNTYLDLYSTYNCKGLPVGAICNPGNDAIKAVLWPQTTSYYFFAHDDDGNIYLARTANEQNANVNKAAKSSSSDDS